MLHVVLVQKAVLRLLIFQIEIRLRENIIGQNISYDSWFPVAIPSLSKDVYIAFVYERYFVSYLYGEMMYGKYKIPFWVLKTYQIERMNIYIHNKKNI